MPSWQVDYRRVAPGWRQATALTIADNLTEAAGNVLRDYPGVELLAVRPAGPGRAVAVGNVLTTAAQLADLPQYAVIVGSHDPDDPTDLPTAWQKWDTDGWHSASYWATFDSAQLVAAANLQPGFRVVWLPGDPAPS